MYPILLKIGYIEIQSYYVLWGIALIIAMLWANKRIDISGLPVNEASSVVTGSFIGMILGASCLKYFTDWRLYYENPVYLLDINRGGISEVGAIVAAIIVAFIICKVKKISFCKFSEVTSPAVLLAMALGRWGCYLNGCCEGIKGHPTQLYYSFTAAIILSIVLMLENYNRRNGIIYKYGIVSPIGLGLYSTARILIDPYRLEAATEGIILTDRIFIVCAVISLVWLIVSIMTTKVSKQ